MTLQQVGHAAPGWAQLAQVVGAVGSTWRLPGQPVVGIVRDPAPRLVNGSKRAEQDRGGWSAPLPDPTRKLLSAAQFDRLVERESRLADRGTRRFTVLDVRRTPGSPGSKQGDAAQTKLVAQASERLRSTDLLAHAGIDRVRVLLTDTDAPGARVVAAWVEAAGRELGLVLDLTIYVYPSMDEPERGERKGESRPLDQGSETRTNGSSTGMNGHGMNGYGATAEHPPDSDNGTAGNGDRPGARADGHARREEPEAQDGPVAPSAARSWPTRDLWPTLTRSTPLAKRTLDITVSLAALLALFPLLLLIAIAIRLDSPGPVIFRQLRAGRGARPFVFYKFRSMCADAEERRSELQTSNEQDGPVFKIREDPRITRVGAWLRRWSFDELPQLFNVLKGDISLVGPRSPTMNEVDFYERWQRRRLSIVGGITCTWQVSGRTQIPFREWMRLDLRYIARRNGWHDVWLLARTLPAVISGRGAC